MFVAMTVIGLATAFTVAYPIASVEVVLWAAATALLTLFAVGASSGIDGLLAVGAYKRRAAAPPADLGPIKAY
jgi:hypothetical protein